jgi:CRP-like cAMP-binding protein
VLVRAGKACHTVFRLTFGWAYLERLLPDGRRTILDFYLPGDVIGLDHLFLQPSQYNVLTLTGIGYHTLSCKALLSLFRQNSGVALEISRLLVEEKRRLQRHAMHLARLSSLERTATGLLHLCERLAVDRSGDDLRDSRAVSRLPLPRQLLADYLGLNVVHLNRALATLRESKALIIAGDELVIENLQRLTEILMASSGLV